MKGARREERQNGALSKEQREEGIPGGTEELMDFLAAEVKGVFVAWILLPFKEKATCFWKQPISTRASVYQTAWWSTADLRRLLGGQQWPTQQRGDSTAAAATPWSEERLLYVDDSGNELLQLPSAARRSSAHSSWGESSESPAADCDQRQTSRRQRSEPLAGAYCCDVTASGRDAENASEGCLTKCVPGSPCALADVTTVLRKRCPRRAGDTADRQPFLEIHAVTN